MSERIVEGNITTVRTIAGSAWKGRARLIEEASIGGDEDDDTQILGIVRGVVVSNDVIYVLDEQVPAVRMYSLDGVYLGDFGRDGDGPGEFRRPYSIARHPQDGRIFVRDGTAGRLNVYSATGDALDRWLLTSGFNTTTPMVMTEAGNLYTLILIDRTNGVLDWEFGMALCGPEGSFGDTIAAPQFDFEKKQLSASREKSSSTRQVPFSPDVVWALAPDGSMIGGVSDEYRFSVFHPDGTTTIIEREGVRVPVDEEEATWHRDAITAGLRRNYPGWVWNGPAIPRYKAAYDELYPDHSGRVWIRRPGPGIKVEGGVEDPFEDHYYWLNPYWRDSYIYDVFELSGRYLGEVEMPEDLLFCPEPRSPFPYIEGDMVVAYMEDSSGTPYVKRYRIVLPGSQ